MQVKKKFSPGELPDCNECAFFEKCKAGEVEFCEVRDDGEVPEGTPYYDLETGEFFDPTPKEANPMDRIIYLDNEISRKTVLPVIKDIMKFNKEDSNKPPEDRMPIKIYISCDGGEEVAGNALIDVIEQSLTPIHAIGVGMVYSMATLVFLAAHKRFAFNKTEFLIHDGMCDSNSNSSTKLYDTIDFLRRRNDRIKEFVLSRSLIPEEMYDAKSREEWYLFADEAKNYGLVDMIVGEDADLYDIM